MPLASQVHALSEQLGTLLKQHQLKLATAESCTGGQLAQTITAIPGASLWFELGFITYSNLSKQALLGVSEETLRLYGAVSKETAAAMAEGVLKNSVADISIAITGIAGPSGGTKTKPVGTVYFAWSDKNSICETCKHQFDGERLIIRYDAVAFSLKKLILLLQKKFKT